MSYFHYAFYLHSVYIVFTWTNPIYKRKPETRREMNKVFKKPLNGVKSYSNTPDTKSSHAKPLAQTFRPNSAPI